jgi:colanic acid/amylovoran biosynthesis glycosyltransferase
MIKDSKFLYFTHSYPYGDRKEWKKHELEVLREYFEDITVIPFDYGGNFDNPVQPIEGVKYLPPLYKSYKRASLLTAFSQILFSKHLFFFLKEFFSKKVWADKRKIRRWILNSHFIERLNKHPTIEKLLLKASEPTIAYFFWGKRTAEVSVLLKNTCVKTVCRFHGFDLYAFRYDTPYLPYQGTLIKKLDKVLTISEHGKQYLSELYPDEIGKIKILQLGTVSKGRTSHSQDGTFRIASCSRVISLKRVHLILEALFNIPSDYIVHWTHLGDGESLPAIKKRAKDLPKHIKAEFPGWVTSNQVFDHYLQKPVDLFINVSETEGIPVSIMEAMSAGIPVMATNVGGSSEIVNNENGLLLNPEISAEELAQKILAFLSFSPDQIKYKRKAAYQAYNQGFNAIHNAKILAKDLLEM